MCIGKSEKVPPYVSLHNNKGMYVAKVTEKTRI